MSSFLADNPYFSAGCDLLQFQRLTLYQLRFGLIGVGAALAVFQKGGVHAYTLLRRRLLVTVEIPSKDPAYPWFLKWASQNSSMQASGGAAQRDPGPSSFLSRMLTSNQLSLETSYIKRDNGSAVTSFSFVPAPGRHFFRYKNAWMQIERARERSMIDLKSGSPWETVTITALNKDKDILLDILNEARKSALSAEDGKTVIYTSFGPEWRPFGQPRRRRNIDSVVLEDGLSSQIIGDVKNFLSNGKWYYDRGIPYRRGYLFYGPPGTGKTSFIQALAGHFEYNICVMNMSERGMTDDRLAHLLANAPHRSLILLEDIDAAFSQRDSNDKFQSMVTFSGLLNALDGIAASEERLVFMTTNHLERLDPALVRPGRVDFRALFDDVTYSQAQTMFLKFYPDRLEMAKEFTDKIMPKHGETRRCSPAALQGHFVLYRDDPLGAINNAEKLF
ncbi:mitochondrial chaperone [Phlyctochytrium planicorne]|nr:mitochondrial chaperone [Phlyctochytrium planicorne]